MMVRRSGCWLALAVSLWLAAAPAAASEKPHTGLSLEGYSGLLTVPHARTSQDGWATFLYSNRAIPGFTPARDAHTFVLHVGLFPYVEIAGRITEVNGDTAAGQRPTLLRDLSLNLKVELPLYELDPWLPAIALGTQDEGGSAPHFRTRYLVLSQDLWRFRLTLGYGTGPDRLEGIFGGVEAALLESTSLMVEYDGNRPRAGARVQLPGTVLSVPFRVGLLASTTLDDDPGVFEFALTASAPLDLGARPLTWDEPPTTPAPVERPADCLAALQQSLADHGFENVRVGTVGPQAPHGGALYIEYENELYNWSEWDGVRAVLHTVRDYACTESGDVVLHALHQRIPVAEVRRDGRSGAIEVRQAPAPMEGVTFATPAPANLSRFHARVALSPGLRTFLATEIGVLDYVASIRPELTLPLWKGAALHARWDIPFAWSRALGDGGPLGFYRGAPHLEHALLYQGAHIAPGFVGQIGLGVFRRTSAGALGELYWAPARGVHQFGLQAAYTRTSEGETHASLVASYRGFWLPFDSFMVVRGGQFFAGDRGAMFEVGRYLGDTAVSLFATRTDQTLIGATISLPLTPRRDMRPGWVQIRGDDRWRYSQSTLIQERSNPIVRGVGVVPISGYSLEETWFDAGRWADGSALKYR